MSLTHAYYTTEQGRHPNVAWHLNWTPSVAQGLALADCGGVAIDVEAGDLLVSLPGGDTVWMDRDGFTWDR